MKTALILKTGKICTHVTRKKFINFWSSLYISCSFTEGKPFLIHCIPRGIRELRSLQTNTTGKFSLALSLFLPWVIKLWPETVSGLASSSCPRTTVLVSGHLFLDPAAWCDPGVRRFTIWFWLYQYFLCVFGQSSLHSIVLAFLPLLPRCTVYHTNKTSYSLIMSHVSSPLFPAHVGPHTCGRLPHCKLHL